MSFKIDEMRRRGGMALAAAVAMGIVVPVGNLIVPANAMKKVEARKKKEKEETEENVSATEDLMREHGVLRRALIVYSELSNRLRAGSGSVEPSALVDAAKLFREFGEQYHERMLEEQYIFPEVRKAGGPNEKLVEVLLAQHHRGREITDYLYQIGSGGQLSGQAEPLSSALAGMARMYRAHAAWEDTIIFPAWKMTQSKRRLDDLAAKFEEIEHQQFGQDGFEDALKRIERVEQALGLSDLGSYTAPSPPKL